MDFALDHPHLPGLSVNILLKKCIDEKNMESDMKRVKKRLKKKRNKSGGGKKSKKLATNKNVKKVSGNLHIHHFAKKF